MKNINLGDLINNKRLFIQHTETDTLGLKGYYKIKQEAKK